jgi:hypothetical protein
MTYTKICARLECSSLNVLSGRKIFGQTLMREIKLHVLHSMQFSVSFPIFETIKENQFLCSAITQEPTSRKVAGSIHDEVIGFFT